MDGARTHYLSDVPFETEAELRVRGTARTPDILLSCPVGVRVRRRKESRSNYPLGSMPSPQKPRIVNNLEEDGDDDDDDYEWKIICWIDSKVSLQLSFFFSYHAHFVVIINTNKPLYVQPPNYSPRHCSEISKHTQTAYCPKWKPTFIDLARGLFFIGLDMHHCLDWAMVMAML